MDLGFYSYVGAAIAYGFFALLLLFGWRGSSLQGRWLTGTIILSAIWAGLAAKVAQNAIIYVEVYQTFEILRYVAWYAFLLNLFGPAAKQSFGYRRFLRWSLPLSTGFAFLLLVFDYIAPPDLLSLHIIGHVFLAIFGIAIIEQLFRNTSVRHLWTVRHLFIGVAGIFAFDFYAFSPFRHGPVAGARNYQSSRGALAGGLCRPKQGLVFEYFCFSRYCSQYHYHYR